jgi:hypothetical protein
MSNSPLVELGQKPPPVIYQKAQYKRIGQRDVLPRAIHSQGIQEGGVGSSNIYYYARERSAVVSPSSSVGSDEFTDIQRAINFVADRLSASNGVIFIKSGYYSVKKNIYVPSGFRIEGENRQSVVIDFGNSNFGFRMGYSTSGSAQDGAEGCDVSNLTLNQSSGNAIYYNTAHLSTIKSVIFAENGCDINGSSFTNCCIENCLGSDSDNFLNVTGDFSYGRIENNIIETDKNTVTIGNDLYSSFIQGNNFISDNGNYGIKVVGQIYLSRVDGNDILLTGDDTTGIYMGDGDTSSVSKNNIYNPEHGIRAVLSTYVVVIDGNYITISGGDAININYCYYTKLSNNSVGAGDSGTNGFVLTGGRGSAVHANDIDGNYTGTGLSFTNTDYVTISGNTVKTFDNGCVIDNQTDRATIVGNVFYNNNSANFTNNGTNTQDAANVTA